MNRVPCSLLAICAGFSLCALPAVVVADPPAPPALSKYIPADELVQQIDLYVASCQEGLTDAQTYTDKSRQITKDAHTIAALALVLAKHDSDHRLKAAAPALLSASRALAAAKDYASAKQAMTAVSAAAKGEAKATADEPKWDRVASLGQLMKQVTFVNNRLRRNFRRFEERKDDNARDAAVLAAIAQVTVFDTHEVKDAADHDKWYQLCDEMRDAAGDLHAQIRAGDKSAAEKALTNLGKSCESCHEQFRVRTSP